MLATLNLLFTGLVFAGLPLWVVCAWMSWVRRSAKPFRARTLAALLGLAGATASAALEVGSALYLQTSGAAPLDAAVPPRLHVAGLALAGLGLVSLFGETPRTPPRWTTPALALTLLAIWSLHVCSQDL